MYTLLLITNAAIHSIQGFPTEQSCVVAANQIEEASTYCIEIPEAINVNDFKLRDSDLNLQLVVPDEEIESRFL